MNAQPLGQMIIELGLDSSNFSRGMKGVNQQIKTSMTEMKSHLNVMGRSGSEIDKLKAKQTGLTGVIAAQNNKVALAKEKYDACRAAVEGNAQATQEQREALIRAQNVYVRAIGELGSYENQLQEVQIRLTTMESGLYQAGTAVTKFGERMTKVGDVTAKAGAAMVAGVTTPLIALATYAVKTTAEFDAAMSQVSAVSGAVGEDFDKLRDKAREMGEKTKFSAKEAADAMNYMAMAGWKTGEMLDGIEGIMNLAAASGESLAATSDIVTDALTGFGHSSAESGRLADIMAAASSNANTNVGLMGQTFKYCTPIAGALGFSMEDTAEAIGLMANSGVKASMAGTAMRSMMNNLAGEVKFAGEKLGEVTISTQKYDGSMRELGDILADCREAFSQMTEAEKVANAESLVGKNAMSGFLAVMNAAPADIEKLNQAIANSDGVAAAMAETMGDNLTGQLTILKSQTDELAISFGDILMPKIREMVSGIQGTVDKLNQMDDGTKNAVVSTALFAAAVGPVVLVVGKLTSGIGTLTTNVGTAMTRFAAYNARLQVTTGLTVAQTIAEKAQNIALMASTGRYSEQAVALNAAILAKIKETVATHTQTSAHGTAAIGMGIHTIATNVQTVATNACAVATGFLSAAIKLLFAPIGAIIAVIAILVAGVVAVVKWFNRESEAAKQLKSETEDLAQANDALVDSLNSSQSMYEDNTKSIKAGAGAAKNLADKVTELSKVENKSAKQKKELQTYVGMLNDSMEGLNIQYDAQTDALSMTTAEIYHQISALEKQAEAQAAQERMIDILKEQMSVNEQLTLVQEKITEATENNTLKNRERKDILEDLTTQEAQLQGQLESLGNSYVHVTDVIVQSAAEESEAVVENTQTILEAYGSVGKAYEDLGKQQQQAIDGIVNTFETMTGQLSNLTEKIKLDNKTTWTEIQKNQADTITKTKEFSELYAQLIEAGVSESYLNAIGATGPESIPLLKGMLKEGTDAVLASQDEWQEAYSVIGDTLVSSLELDDTASGAIKDYILGESGVYGTLQGAIGAADLNALGKSLTEGVSKGILENTDSLEGAATSMADTTTAAANDAWDINSPSKVFAEIGKFLMQGLVQGLTNHENTVYAKATEIANNVTRTMKTALDIHSPSRIMRDEVGKNIALGIAEGITKNKKYAKKSAEDIADAIVQAAQKKLDNTKVYNELTLADEVAFWDSVRKQVTEGTQARIDADKKYFDAKKSLSQEVESLNKKMVDLETNYAAKIKKVNEDLKSSIKSLQDSYDNALKSRTQSITSSMGLFDEFAAKTELTTKDLLNNLHSQVIGLKDWSNNLKALEKRGVTGGMMEELQSLGTSAAGEIALMTEMTDEELKEYVALWKEKQKLATKQATKELEPMADEVEQQIYEMRIAAAKELEEYKNEFVSAMSEIGEQIQTPLKEVQKSLLDTMSMVVQMAAGTISTEADKQSNVNQFAELAASVFQASASLPGDFTSLGVNTIEGMIQGLQSKAGSLYQTMTEIIREAIQAARDEAQIHSPSRVMMSIGSYLIEGVGVGMKNMQSYVEGVVHDMTGAITEGWKMDISSASLPTIDATVLTEKTGTIQSIKRILESLRAEEEEAKGSSSENDNLPGLLEQMLDGNQKMITLLQTIASKNSVIDKSAMVDVVDDGIGGTQQMKVRRA